MGEPNANNLKGIVKICLFINNSKVDYKDGSLASCCVGTVSNSKHKAKHT